MSGCAHSGARGASSSGLSPATARRLAALIVADAQQLQDRAQDAGVTAFVGRAVQRERPNERFLQNTLRNLASANKRAEERDMWAAWQQQQRQQQQQQVVVEQPGGRQRHAGGSDGAGAARDGSSRRGRSRSRSSSSNRSRSRSRSSSRARRLGASPSSHRSRSADDDRPAGAERAHVAGNGGGGRSDDDGGGDAAADERLRQWPPQSRGVRGRGATGPHADVARPYLPAPQQRSDDAAVACGPERPTWLKQAAGQQRLAPNTASVRGVLSSHSHVATGEMGAGSRDDIRSDDTSGSSSSRSRDSGEQRAKARKRRHSSSSKRHKKKHSSRKGSSNKHGKRHRKQSRHSG
jgi:hypothetical protein